MRTLKSPDGGLLRPSAGPLRILGFAALLVGAVLVGLSLRMAGGADPVATWIEPFNHGVVSDQGSARVQGFVPHPKGWALPAHSPGSLVYVPKGRVPERGALLLTLQVFGGPPALRSALGVGPDPEGPFALVARDRDFLGTTVDLRPFLPGAAGGLALRIEASNLSDETRLVVDKLSLRAFPGNPVTVPPPGGIVTGLLLLAAGGILLSAQPLQAAAAAALVVLGIGLRSLNFLRVAWTPLDPDAEVFRQYAESLRLFGRHGFYSGTFGEREPLFLLVVKAVQLAFGDSAIHLRLLTVGLSAGVLLATYHLARRLFGPRWALLVLGLTAVSVPLIIESGRGLRLELETLLVIGLLEAGWLGRDRSGLSWALRVGALGGLLLLTRAFYLPAVVLLAILTSPPGGSWRVRGGLVALALLVAVGVFVPHKLGIARVHGTAFWDTDIAARWLANEEFAGRPGFPSIEDVARNPYAGPRISFLGYLFGLHTPGEVLWRALRGFGKIVADMNLIGYVEAVQALSGLRLGWLDLTFVILGASGLLLSLTLPDLWILPVAFGVLVAHMAFLSDIGFPDHRYRLTYQAFPLMACGVVVSLRRIAHALGTAHREAPVVPARASGEEH